MFTNAKTRTKLLCSLTVLMVLVGLFAVSATVLASPFGVGYFDADVPFGGQTSLAISTDGNVNIPITPTTSGVLATGTSTVTVTSTDVVGYKLYIQALSSTNLGNGGSNVAASANVTPAALSINTWGYNTDASTNFAGITLSNALIKTGSGPFESGDNTTVTYGLKMDDSLPAGDYSTTVVYTVVPQTE